MSKPRSNASERRPLVATAVMFVSVLLVPSVPAWADAVVLEWNQIALTATVTAAQGSVPQVRSMALVHAAVHDAVNAITCKYQTYLSMRCGPWGSPEAAAIAAAHRVLVGLFQSQTDALDRTRAASLAAHGLTAGSPGVVFGETVGAMMLAVRSADGAAQAQFAYAAPNAGDPGVWVAVGAAAPVLPGWGSVSLWVLRNVSQFEPGGPPPLHSRRYARDYNEVKDMGSATSTARTSEQTEIARFWLASPSAIWNGVARQLIQSRGLDVSASARTLALLYLASADASVACWNTKYSTNFWRPITAIRNGAADDNDLTEPDPAWTPLFPTPQHPEYVSGHTTNSSAMATVLTVLFGDRQDPAIVATSPTNQRFERHWSSFSEGVEEVIDARIFSGFHYRSSNEDGAELGRKVGRFVMTHALRDRTAPND
jgi:hypothetical protein